MRRIEFRGQKTDTKEWIFGDLIQLEKEFKKVVEILDWSKVENTNKSKSDLTVIQETVGQFTGKYDQFKNKIFEGDICEVLYYNHSSPDVKIIQEVIFENGCFILRAKNHLGLELEDSRLYVPLYYSDAPNKIKIIGNIHDNTEFSLISYQ